VVVDDGSTDATPGLLADTARADPRFTLVTTTRRGLVAALATGLERCTAPFVARMDADDWMHRDRLAAQLVAFADQPSRSALGTWVRIFPRERLTEGRRGYEQWLNGLTDCDDVRRDAFVECPIAHPSLMIRRDVLQAFGYRDCGWAEDYDLILRLIAAGHEIAVVPRRLLGWRDSSGRLSRRSADYSLDRFTACKAAHLAAGFLSRTSHYVLWGYGSTGRALRRALLAHHRTPSQIVELHPGRIGQRIHGAPVIHPDALRGLHGIPIVVSVAGAGPRGQIRQALVAMGFRELDDFVCAA
jgi:glycosyltransferase involved in cell wall biosynthesis